MCGHSRMVTLMRQLMQQFHYHKIALFAALGAMLGTAFFFSWPASPVFWGVPLLLTCTLVLSLMPKPARSSAVLPLAGAVYLLLAHWVLPVSMNVQANNSYWAWVNGRVVEIEEQTARSRLILDNVTIYTESEPVKPTHVRISVARSRLPNIQVGDGVALQAEISMPPQPAFPGDYDGRLPRYMQELPYTGYAKGDVYQTFLPYGEYTSLTSQINRWRSQLSARVQDDSTGLPAALLAGKRGGIEQKLYQAFQKSGLAHLLAISGLHIGMVAGLIFFSMRWLAAWSPWVSLHLPTKVMSAVIALVGSGGYVLLAGVTIPTLRAFVMVAAVLLAVILGRFRMSLRMWAWAVLIVLALWPHSVLTASFQLSFCAALALILWAQHFTEADAVKAKRPGYFRGIWESSLVAGLATMPLVAMHFGHVSLIGFGLNLLAIPLLGLWILPTAMLSVLLLPFGLAAPFLWAMHQGCAVLADIAMWGAANPLGGVAVAQSYWPVLALLAVGALWFMYQRLWLPFTTVFVGLCAFLWLAPWPARPEVASFNHGQTVLVRASEGTYYPWRQSKNWQEKWLLERFLTRQNATLATAAPAMMCDAIGCVWSGYLMAKGDASAEDCTYVATIVGSNLPNLPCQTVDLAAHDTVLIRQQNVHFYAAPNGRIWHNQ